jgi:NAD(P)-dependent dehydrogenase (short-subunit alcohol dehydrogenase family)
VRPIAADPAKPLRLIEAIGEAGQLDALVHCTAVSVYAIAPVAATDPAVWQQTINVNVLAPAELTRLLLPALRRSRGHVVFINSSRGIRAVPNWSAFAASKAAQQELADSLRAEEAENGVRVTTVCPGATATEHLRDVRAKSGFGYDPQRHVQPGTLAAIVEWVLAAPADAYVSDVSVLAGPLAA